MLQDMREVYGNCPENLLVVIDGLRQDAIENLRRGDFEATLKFRPQRSGD